MLAVGFLAFWLWGLDTAGRSSIGKNKLIRPGMCLCFESGPCSRGTFAVTSHWRVVRGHALGLENLCTLLGLPHGEGISLGRTRIWVVLLDHGCQHSFLNGSLFLCIFFYITFFTFPFPFSMLYIFHNTSGEQEARLDRHF